MSEDIVPIVRQAHDTFNRRDLDGFLELCRPDFRFRASFEGVELGGYEGDGGRPPLVARHRARPSSGSTSTSSTSRRTATSALVHGRGRGLGRASGGGGSPGRSGTSCA